MITGCATGKRYHQCTKIKLPETQGVRPVRDFLRAVSTISPEFSTYWINDTTKAQKERKDTPDLYRIVELSGDHRRHLAAEEGQTSHGAFATSSQANRKKPSMTTVEIAFVENHIVSKTARTSSKKSGL